QIVHLKRAVPRLRRRAAVHEEPALAVLIEHLLAVIRHGELAHAVEQLLALALLHIEAMDGSLRRAVVVIVERKYGWALDEEEDPLLTRQQADVVLRRHRQGQRPLIDIFEIDLHFGRRLLGRILFLLVILLLFVLLFVFILVGVLGVFFVVAFRRERGRIV